MKLFISTVLLVLCMSQAFAQPTLTKHLKFDIGDSVTIYGCDTNGIYAAITTGANVTWNINLTYNDSGTYTYIDKSGSTVSGLFPGTNIVEKWPSGTHWFCQKTATEFRYIGRASGTNPTAILAPYRKVAVWPFTYNDSYTDTVPVSYPQTGNSGTTYYTHVADAYGTLTVNGKTYTNVLRTKSNNDAFNTLNSPIESIEYIRFWDATHKAPILSIRRYELKLGSNPPPPSYEVYLLKEEKTTGVYEAKERLVNINAHTLNGRLYLNGELNAGKEYQLHLYNYAGQRIKSQTFTATSGQITTAIPDMSSGVYFIQLQERGEAPGYIKFFHH
ncbi:MAG: T9SS type A sorting domain-containing protein [Chitinophagales bacterium]|nr:T9SS type A sorting domain-containing protein [Chitinophagaceae bacterium]MCB9064982.1 T9SS type A sorting domain-containing protein [Chitinophagales bacterium]